MKDTLQSHCQSRLLLSNLFRHFLSGFWLCFLCVCGLVCPDGWRHFSGSCYSHSNDPDTWSGAAYHCKQKGARLVEINSHAENQFLHSYFLKGDGRDHWINLHRCGGSLWCHLSMESAKFTNWDKTQPDNREGVYEACAEMWFTGKWHDAPCEEHQPFMCEKGKINPLPFPLVSLPPPPEKEN